LAETAANLHKIGSAVLDFELTAGAGAQPSGEQTGIKLQGPFALGAPGHLPTSDITYTRYLGRTTRTVRVTTTADKAYVTTDGRSYLLPAAQADLLRASKDSSKGGLGDLDLGRWVDKPQVSDGGVVDGVASQRIAGQLRVVDAFNQLFAVSRQLGASDVVVPHLQGALAAQLQRNTQSATTEIVTGKDDHMVRRLAFDVLLSTDAPPSVRQALGPLAAVRFHFLMTLARPNSPVQVTAPANPLPAADLPAPH
jgi:hypothetical protein